MVSFGIFLPKPCLSAVRRHNSWFSRLLGDDISDIHVPRWGLLVLFCIYFASSTVLYLPGRPSWMCLFDTAHFGFLIEIFKNFCNVPCLTLHFEMTPPKLGSACSSNWRGNLAHSWKWANKAGLTNSFRFHFSLRSVFLTNLLLDKSDYLSFSHMGKRNFYWLSRVFSKIWRVPMSYSNWRNSLIELSRHEFSSVRYVIVGLFGFFLVDHKLAPKLTKKFYKVPIFKVLFYIFVQFSVIFVGLMIQKFPDEKTSYQRCFFEKKPKNVFKTMFLQFLFSFQEFLPVRISKKVQAEKK